MCGKPIQKVAKMLEA